MCPSDIQLFKKGKAVVPGRRRGLPPILQDPREEDRAFTMSQPVGRYSRNFQTREEDGLSVPSCAPREEEQGNMSCRVKA